MFIGERSSWVLSHPLSSVGEMPPNPLFPRLFATQIAFLAGLLVGEGSFTGDNYQPHCALKMTARHEHLLRLMQSWCPLSRIYGPHAMTGNRQDTYMVIWRGPALGQLIHELEDFGLQDYCPHVYGRMMVTKARLLAD